MQTAPKFPKIVFIFTLLLWVIDLYLSLTSPVSIITTKLGLGPLLPRYILSIGFSLPLFISFFYGAWTALLLFNNKIGEAREQQGFKLFAASICVITTTIILAVLVGAMRSRFFFSDTYGMYKFFTIVLNYIYALGYFLGFLLLLLSSKKFLSSAFKWWNIVVSASIVFLLGGFYFVTMFTNPDRLFSTTRDIMPTYFISDGLLFYTIILPVTASWFFAIFASFSLADILFLTKDARIKLSINKILYGTLFIVFSAIIIQAIISVGTTRFVESGLGLIVVVLYALVIVMLVGNYLVFRGAMKLTD